MKKVILLIMMPFFLLLISCFYRGYSGEDANLYTVAINSVPWLNGHSWSADFESDPQLEIIDTDQYKRIMFIYYEKYYSGSDISFSSLIICQTSNEKEVFYYEDVNFIVKEQEIYSQNLKDFTSEEIEYLKLINDWNKPINYSKCIKKEIQTKKSEINYEDEIKNQLIRKFDLVDRGYSLYMDLLTYNLDNSKFIIYGYIRKSENNGICFIGLVEKGQEDKIKFETVVPSNVYDYKDELYEFKKSNNW